MTTGTFGDVVPYVALSQALQSAGHAVVLCACSRYKDFVVQHGIEFAGLNDGLVEWLESDEHRLMFDSDSGPLAPVRGGLRLWKGARLLAPRMLQDGWRCVQKAKPHLIVYNPMTLGGLHFAEKLSIPAAMATAWPRWVATGDFPATGFPGGGRAWNRATYRLNLAVTQRFVGRSVRVWRSEQGLPSLRRGIDPLHTTSGQHVTVLHHHSRHVVRRPAEWPDAAHVTGYWFLKRQDDWCPPAALKRFLGSGEAPVYVGFGSMARRRPEGLTRIVVEALRQAGVRGLISTGWGGLDPEASSETVLGIQEAPHEWLFPQVRAVVHHGGAGTVGAGLHAGRPTVACPFFADQPFWAERIYRLGVGSKPIPQRRLTAARLAKAIREVIQDPSIRQRAEALSKKIQQEDGVGNAVAIIESIRNS